jgi:hypothetical protein
MIQVVYLFTYHNLMGLTIGAELSQQGNYCRMFSNVFSPQIVCFDGVHRLEVKIDKCRKFLLQLRLNILQKIVSIAEETVACC